MTAARSDRDIYTVSRLNRAVRESLERAFGYVWVSGELSNFARPKSGHWYFSLKDSNAQVRCAMFRSRNAQLKIEIDDGMQVLARARVGMYEPRGEYQLIVEQLELAGAGQLQLAFDQLKRKLAAEGLFAREHKIDVPEWPARIGVITSPTGAALRDILSVLGRRNPTIEVILYPSAVQGADAAPELLSALQCALRRDECDVIILARGGGSLEDLWAFNDEPLARAIFASTIPVVSAVGHEIDFSIADFVADLRAATPSASAEICAPDRDEVLQHLRQLETRALRSVQNDTTQWRERLSHLRARLRDPRRQLEQAAQRIDELTVRLASTVKNLHEIRLGKLITLNARLSACDPTRQIALLQNRIATAEQRLASVMSRKLDIARARFDENKRALKAVSPQATLERGYAILTNETGAIARDAADYVSGDELSARLARGRLSLTVIASEVDDQSTKS